MAPTPGKRSHATHQCVESRTVTTTSHRYTRSKMVAKSYVCTSCKADEATPGVCAKDGAKLVEQGTYYCATHTERTALDPGKYRKCKAKMVVADSERAQASRKAKLPAELSDSEAEVEVTRERIQPAPLPSGGASAQPVVQPSAQPASASN